MGKLRFAHPTYNFIHQPPTDITTMHDKMDNILASLKQLAILKKIRFVDFYFAEFILGLERQHRDETQQEFTVYEQNILLLSSALVSHQESLGDVCIHLNQFVKQVLFDSKNVDGIDSLTAPAKDVWQETLDHCSVVGYPGQHAPLILSKSGLYLQKYWHYETSLARYLANASVLTDPTPLESVTDLLEQLFPQKTELDWQQVAAKIALKKPFSVISGGPGTGKTTTITKILALLIQQKLPEKCRIALAAPTGKAAARLTESLLNARKTLDCDEQIQQYLPDQCTSIHRLLGANFSTSRYKYNADNPLHYDVVVVDEASMIDLSLMYHLTQALLPSTRLILLGDKDQLASVDSGSVLGNICSFHQTDYSAGMMEYLGLSDDGTALEHSALSDNICILQKSYRFDENSGIGALAKQINQGNPNGTIEVLHNPAFEDIEWYESIKDRLSSFVLNNYTSYLQTQDIREALNRFNQSQVLCAVRQGKFGVEQINLYIENVLKQHKLIQNNQRFYPCRPIMITKNDYNLQLFNGDIGIVFPDPTENNQLRVFFLNSQNELKKVLPQRLPDHETVFAMTIHKSQGSEFDDLFVLLPNQDSPILTRELIYTGITRAKKRCMLIAEESVLKKSIAQQVKRSSGLKQEIIRLLA